jgi:hypothetical protein
MNYKQWEANILEANSLEKIIEQFRLSSDKVWYLDRHIVDSIDEIPELEDNDNFWSVCRTALALLENWHEYVDKLTDTEILASVPYLVIDDEWLQRQQDSPPPHIRLDLAKQSKYLKPSFFFHTSVETELMNNELKMMLMGKGTGTVRVHHPDEKYGSWIITF